MNRNHARRAAIEIGWTLGVACTLGGIVWGVFW